VLSPILFAVYIDSLICKLKLSRYGAYIGEQYVGCLVYADDILLVSHSIGAMQLMLDMCSSEAVFLDLQFNTKKSVAIRVGPRWQCTCSPLILSNAELTYVEDARYLGIVITAARSFKCSFDHVKLKFYRCFNAIYNKAMHADSELVCVQLLKSFCLPIILYATEAVLPGKTILRILDSLLSRAVYRIFGCSSAEDIKYIRNIVALPSIEDIVHTRAAKFIASYRACRLPFADYVLQVFNKHSV
jgi:Reverse transcriptase (RNA-dependent DNA polymerase)